MNVWVMPLWLSLLSFFFSRCLLPRPVSYQLWVTQHSGPLGSSSWARSSGVKTRHSFSLLLSSEFQHFVFSAFTVESQRGELGRDSGAKLGRGENASLKHHFLIKAGDISDWKYFHFPFFVSVKCAERVYKNTDELISPQDLHSPHYRLMNYYNYANG